MPNPLEDLASMPGYGGDVARDELDYPAGPLETPEQSSQRYASEAQQQVRQKTSALRQLAGRGIPAYADDDSPGVQTVNDESGTPLTDFDEKHQIAYDSTGSPRKLRWGPTGAPTLSDPYDVPTTTDQDTGDQYKVSPGLPWQYVGQDSTLAAQAAHRDRDKALQHASEALQRKLTQDEHMAIVGEHDYQQGQKQLSGVIPSLKDPEMAGATQDQVTSAINGHFDDALKDPRANQKDGWFSSTLSPEAIAYQQDVQKQRQSVLQKANQLFQQRQTLDAQKQRMLAQRGMLGDWDSQLSQSAISAVPGLGPSGDQSQSQGPSQSPQQGTDSSISKGETGQPSQQPTSSAQSAGTGTSSPNATIDVNTLRQSFPKLDDGQLQAVAAAKSGQKPYTLDEKNQVQFDPMNPVGSLQQAKTDRLIDPQQAEDLTEKLKPLQQHADELRKLQQDHPELSKAMAFGHGASIGAAAGAGALGAMALGNAGPNELIGGLSLPLAWLTVPAANVVEGLIGAGVGAYAAHKAGNIISQYTDALKPFEQSSELHPNYDTAGNLTGMVLTSGGIGSLKNLAGAGGIAAKGAQEAGAGLGGQIGAAAKTVGGPIASGAAAGAGFETVIRPAWDAALNAGADALGIQHDKLQPPTVGSVLQNAAVGALLSGHGITFKDYDSGQIAEIMRKGLSAQMQGVPMEQSMPQSEIEAFDHVNGELSKGGNTAHQYISDPTQFNVKLRQALLAPDRPIDDKAMRKYLDNQESKWSPDQRAVVESVRRYQAQNPDAPINDAYETAFEGTAKDLGKTTDEVRDIYGKATKQPRISVTSGELEGGNQIPGINPQNAAPTGPAAPENPAPRPVENPAPSMTGAQPQPDIHAAERDFLNPNESHTKPSEATATQSETTSGTKETPKTGSETTSTANEPAPVNGNESAELGAVGEAGQIGPPGANGAGRGRSVEATSEHSESPQSLPVTNRGTLPELPQGQKYVAQVGGSRQVFEDHGPEAASRYVPTQHVLDESGSAVPASDKARKASDFVQPAGSGSGAPASSVTGHPEIRTVERKSDDGKTRQYLADHPDVRYDGKLEVPGKETHQFTDEKTVKGTFTVSGEITPKTISEKLKAKREAFGVKSQGAPVTEPVTGSKPAPTEKKASGIQPIENPDITRDTQHGSIAVKQNEDGTHSWVASDLQKKPFAEGAAGSQKTATDAAMVALGKSAQKPVAIPKEAPKEIKSSDVKKLVDEHFKGSAGVDRLKSLGVNGVEYGNTTGNSGSEFVPGPNKIRIDPVKLAKSMKIVSALQKLNHIEGTPKDLLEQSMFQETTHAAQNKVAESAGKTLDQYYSDAPDEAFPSDLMDKAAKAYGPEFKKATKGNQRAEAVRMLMERKITGRITESLYKLLKPLLDILDRLLESSPSEWLKSHVEELHKILVPEKGVEEKTPVQEPKASTPKGEVVEFLGHHGTNNEISGEPRGIGLHYTPDHGLAEKFSRGHREGTPTVDTRQVKLKNALRINDHGGTDYSIRNAIKATGVLTTKETEQLDDAQLNVWREKVSKGIEPGIAAQESFDETNVKLRKLLQAKGYDGIVYENTTEGKPADNAILFDLSKGESVDRESHEAATSPSNSEPEPTKAQKEAGNYKMGHIRIAGLDISIENPQGSARSGVDAKGKPWSVTMGNHYGYIRGTEGVDGDHVDVTVKAGTPEDWSGPVFVVNQINPLTGKFDEHKAILGAADAADARRVYLSNFSPGWKGAGNIHEFPDVSAFKEWLPNAVNDKHGKNLVAPNPAQVLHDAPSVKVRAPAGSTFIRATDAKGRTSIEPIASTNKGSNPFHKAGPFKSVEAGSMGGKGGKEFVPAKGEISIEQKPLGTASPEDYESEAKTVLTQKRAPEPVEPSPEESKRIESAYRELVESDPDRFPAQRIADVMEKAGFNAGDADAKAKLMALYKAGKVVSLSTGDWSANDARTQAWGVPGVNDGPALLMKMAPEEPIGTAAVEHPEKSEALKNDNFAQAAWLAKKAMQAGKNFTDLADDQKLALMKQWRKNNPDAEAASKSFPIPQTFLDGDRFPAGENASKDASRSLSARERDTGKTASARSIEDFRAAAAPLIEASEKAGRVFSPKLLALVGAQGGEHSVVLTPGRVLKFTEPDTAGAVVKFGPEGEPKVFNGTLPEYLRQIDTNRALIGDDTRVEGIIKHPGGAVSIVTSQSAAHGVPPTGEEIDKYLRESGFVPVKSEAELGQNHEYDVWWHKDENIGLIDTKPDNFVKGDDGDLHPIDVKSFTPTAAAKEWMQEGARDARFDLAAKEARRPQAAIGTAAPEEPDRSIGEPEHGFLKPRTEQQAPIGTAAPTATATGVPSIARRLVQELLDAPKFDDFAAAKNRLSATLQMSVMDQLAIVEKMHELVPDPVNREAIGNWIEAKREATRTGETHQEVLDRWASTNTAGMYQAGYDAARSLTPAEKAVAGRVEKFFDAKLKLAQDWGIIDEGLDNYVNRVWRQSAGGRPVAGPGVPGAVTGGKIKPNASFSKSRVWHTAFDAEQDRANPDTGAMEPGNRHLTKDIGEKMAVYVNELNKVIAHHQLIADLSRITAPDGRPAVFPAGVFSTVTDDTGAATAHMSFPTARAKVMNKVSGEKDPAFDYKGIHNQRLLRQVRWVGQDEQGNPVLQESDLLVHPDFAKAVDNITRGSAWNEWANSYSRTVMQSIPKALFRSVQMAQSLAKEAMFSFSGFHYVTIAEHALEHRINSLPELGKTVANLVTMPLPAVHSMVSKSLDLRPPNYRNANVVDWMQHGLMIAPHEISPNSYMEGVGGTSGVNDLAKQINERAKQSKWLTPLRPVTELAAMLGRIAKAISDDLFHRFIPALKLKLANTVLERNLHLYKKAIQSGKVTTDDVKYLTAHQVNAALSHLNKIDLERNPTFQHFLSLVALSPDFTESRGRFAAQAMMPSKRGREQFLALLIGGGVLYGTVRILNQILNGDAHWEPKNAFRIVSGNRAYEIRSVQGDVMKMLSDKNQFVQGRISPLARFGWESFGGRNYRGESVSGEQALAELFTTYLPISTRGLPGIRNLTETSKNNPTTFLEQLAGTMGVHTSRFSPITETYQRAQEWQKATGNANPQGVYPVSRYQQLRYALEDSDMERAREEWQNLKNSGESEAKLKQGFSTSINHPFTGSKDTDQKFVASMDAAGKQVYQQAVRTRQAILNRFYSIAR